jgi:hypothetical protein
VGLRDIKVFKVPQDHKVIKGYLEDHKGFKVTKV